MKPSGTKTENLIICSLFTALLVICSWISIPTAVPFTMQTFAVFLSILVLGTKRSLLVLLTYFFLGVIGIPVFAGFQSGIGILAGPLGGYMLGFFATCFISGSFLPKQQNRPFTYLLLTAGLASCYLIGTLWFVHFHAENGCIAAVSVCVIPFILPDACKMVLAVTISEKLKKAIK